MKKKHSAQMVSVVLVGPSGAGKTELFNRLTKSRKYGVTCACQCMPARFCSEVLIWDTPGSERLQKVLKAGMCHASVLVVVIEQDQFSEAEIQKWVMKGFLNRISPGVLVCLTKCKHNQQPKCSYKTILVNTKTGLGVYELSRFMSQTCANLQAVRQVGDVKGSQYVRNLKMHCAMSDVMVDVLSAGGEKTAASAEYTDTQLCSCKEDTPQCSSWLWWVLGYRK